MRRLLALLLASACLMCAGCDGSDAEDGDIRSEAGAEESLTSSPRLKPGEDVKGKAVEGNWKTKRTAMTPREYWERLKRSFNDKYVKEVEKRQGKENNHDAEPVD